MTEFNPFEKASSFEKDLIPEGPHAVRCVRVLEIGQQSSPKYPDPKPKVVVAFTLPNITIDIGGEEKQRMISNPFGITISNDDRSTMSQYARALCPQGGASMGDFLGRAAQAYIRHRPGKEGRVYEDIDSLAALLPGVDVPEADLPLLWLKWNDPDPEVYSQIPAFTQNMIKQAANYHGSKMEEMVLAFEGDQSAASDEPRI